VTPARALVDTSVWISPPSGGLSGYAQQVALSIVTVAELQYGLTVPDVLQAAARRKRLAAILDRHLALPLDLETTERYGLLAGLVRQQGRNPRPRRLDLLIAATAARHRLPLLTRNAVDLAGLEQVVTVVDVRD
jgi:predicted nucleic acid-binding protein